MILSPVELRCGMSLCSLGTHVFEPVHLRRLPLFFNGRCLNWVKPGSRHYSTTLPTRGSGRPGRNLSGLEVEHVMPRAPN
jgi:hypothetical protein